MSNIDRDVLMERASNGCEVCWGSLETMSVHHRRPRQMGGTKVGWINTSPNLLVICGTGNSGCHGLIESYRKRSYEHGWLLHPGWSPEETPFADLHANWWLLIGNDKYPITTPFIPPNPSSISPVRSIGLEDPKKEETNDHSY